MKRARKLVICLFWLILWQVVAVLVDNSILLAGPIQVLEVFWNHAAAGDFWHAAFSSYTRIMGGFLTAFYLGIFCGVCAYRVTWIKEFFAPLISTVKAIPVAAFVVILLIWSGSSHLAFWCCFLIVFPNLYENTIAGLKSTDDKLLQMAKIYHVTWWKKLFYIYRPALMPYLISSSKITVGMAFKSGVAAEIIGVPAFSIGERMYLSKIQLDTAGVLAWTLVVILLSAITEKVFLELLGAYAGRQNTLVSGRTIKRGRTENKNTDVIKLENLSKTYDGEAVLTDITFAMEKGGIYCIMGTSGVGKSTLFRLLMGLEKPDEAKSIAGISGEHFSAVFQENRLCEETDSVNNVWLVRDGWKKAKVREELAEILPQESLDKPVSVLSGGMKRRVAVCRAMTAESDIVFMDEPFTGLDEETRKKVIDYILRKRKGRTLIMATHMEEDVLQLGGRVIRIK